MQTCCLQAQCLPEKDGDTRLTLTAAVMQHFHTEAAIFGRYHLSGRGGGKGGEAL